MTGASQSPVSRVIATGMYVPERIVSNEYFASYLDTSDEWIRSRTGIEQRRWADESMSVSDMAYYASQQALERANLSAEDIDAIVFATVTPDCVFPSSATYLQKKLGMGKGFAFDVNAVCSGFLYAFSVADSLMRSGMCRTTLVVGADMYSRIINKNDRSTCVLFGDGAGAVILEASSEAGGKGVHHNILLSDAQYTDILRTPSGTAFPITSESLTTDAHYLQMEGREVFKLAVRRLSEINKRIVDESQFSLSDIDYFVTHQANRRIVEAVGDKLGARPEQVPMNVAKYGNTSAASVPILLSELQDDGKLVPGTKVVISAFGGGVTWGASLFTL